MKNLNNTATVKSNRMSLSSIVLILIAALIVVIAILYAISQIMGVYTHVTANFNEIKFAYDHPSLIKGVEQDYASKSASLEESYKYHSPTPQDQLIETVTQSLQSKQ